MKEKIRLNFRNYNKVHSLTMVFILILSVSLADCTSVRNGKMEPGSPESTWRCEPIPSTFSEFDLIGSWKAVYGEGSISDTVILREDGKYKQIFVNEVTGYSYESQWNEWWLESRKSGGIYVHFEQMLYCEFQDNCEKPQDVIGEAYFYDYCEDRYLQMESERILALAGSKPYDVFEESPKGIVLRHMRPPGSEGPYYYFTLQE